VEPSHDLVARLVLQARRIFRDLDKVFWSLPRSPRLWIMSSGPLCKESDARSLREGGGELGKLKTLTNGFTIFTQR
jgi:hypothetical protein